LTVTGVELFGNVGVSATDRLSVSHGAMVIVNLLLVLAARDPLESVSLEELSGQGTPSAGTDMGFTVIPPAPDVVTAPELSVAFAVTE